MLARFIHREGYYDTISLTNSTSRKLRGQKNEEIDKIGSKERIQEVGCGNDSANLEKELSNMI